MPPAGFEPAIVGVEIRCLIHWATGACTQQDTGAGVWLARTAFMPETAVLTGV